MQKWLRTPAVLLACCAGVLFGCADRVEVPGPADVVAQALAGLGGRQAVADLDTFSIAGKRDLYASGQGPEPGIGHMITLRQSDWTVSYDIPGRRFRMDLVARVVNEIDHSRYELITGDAGFVIGQDDFYGNEPTELKAMDSDRRAAAIKTERLLNPHILLKEVIADPGIASLQSAADPGAAERRFSDDEFYPVTIARARQSGRRTLLSNEQWLGRWQGTAFLESLVETIETDSEWLQNWRESYSSAPTDHRLVIDDEVYPITLHINAGTGRIAKLETMEWDVVYGDVPLEVAYLDWQPVDGVYFPMHVRMSLAGAPSLEIRRTAVKVNPAFDPAFFAEPEDVIYQHDEERHSRGLRLSQSVYLFTYAGVGRSEVTATEVVPGVYLLGALPFDGVYSLAVEQANGVVVSEPGMNDLKGEENLQWIAENIGKPVTHIIPSHHHNDHGAGIRPYVAAGAALLAHETAREFYVAQCARPASKILPDALDRIPVEARVIDVPGDGMYRIDDPLRPIAVYPVTTNHTTDMVLVVLEQQGLLYSGDLYVSAIARMLRAGTDRPPGVPPTSTPFHSAVDLDKAIDRYGLQQVVATLIGSHDRDPVGYADLKAYLADFGL